MMLASAGIEDIPELDALYSEACRILPPEEQAKLFSPEAFIRGENYPEQGDPENFEMLTIRINDMLIGYVMLRRDFPGKDHVEILSLYIGELARGSGSGSMAMKMICRYFCQSGYAAVRTWVSLRGLAGLRFWNRLGFDRILSLETDGNENGSMILERRF